MLTWHMVSIYANTVYLFLCFIQVKMIPLAIIQEYYYYASTELTKDRDNDSHRPQVTHGLVWETEKLAEKYILIEICSDKGLYRMHQMERGLWEAGLLAEGLDLSLKQSRCLLAKGEKEKCQVGKAWKRACAGSKGT